MTNNKRKSVAVTALVLSPIAVVAQYFFSQSLHDGVGGGPTPESMVFLPSLTWGLCCLATLGLLYMSLGWGWKWVVYFIFLLVIYGTGLYIALDEYVSWAAVI
jgi:hypothetical protein